MCRSGRQRSITMSRIKQSEHGPIKTKSNSSPSRAVIGDTKSEAMGIPRPQKLENPRKNRKRSTSVTVGSRRTVKKRTCNDKSSTCSDDTQVGSSIRTSDPGSTGSEKVLEPFFDDVCSVMSKRLRWHTKTDSLDSGTKSSNIFWDNVESNCCATMKRLISPESPSSSTTFSASSPSSARVFMADGTTTRVRRVILHPPPEIASKLRRWIGCCRWTYNAALAYVKSKNYHKKTFFWLRNRFVNESNVAPAHKFLLETPKHVREGAIKDLAQAYATNFKLMRKNTNHRFDIRFRKKKDNHGIVIPKDAFKELKGGGVALYPKMLSSDPIIDQKPTHDCRLSIDRQNRIVLFVPVEVEKFTLLRENQADVVAIDPGVRTFLSTWSPNGEAYKLGDGDSTKAYDMLIRADKLIKSIAKSSGRSKWRKSHVLARLRARIENVQRDLHYQCAAFLTSKYDSILIPVFGSQRMSSKMNRRLTTKTVRSMLGMGHYAFRQRLKEVAQRRGITVTECTEEYTSKTCSCCGWINPSLGGAKTFACRECGSRIDRDLQGAFNIFLKHCKNHPGFYSG